MILNFFESRGSIRFPRKVKGQRSIVFAGSFQRRPSGGNVSKETACFEREKKKGSKTRLDRVEGKKIEKCLYMKRSPGRIPSKRVHTWRHGRKGTKGWNWIRRRWKRVGGTAPLLIYEDQRRCHATLISPVQREDRVHVSNGWMCFWEGPGENLITSRTYLPNSF